MAQSGTFRRWATGRATAVFLLLLLYTLILTSVTQKSLTVDEQGHLFRGTAYVMTGAAHFLWGHPLLASSLNALPLLTETAVTLPTTLPAWESGDWAIAGDRFLWQFNADPLRLIFLGRLPTLWLTLLLAALIARWGREMAGKKAGKTAALIALALFALDPNILAHGGLITSDISVTFFMLLAVYGFWRWATTHHPSPPQNSQFTIHNSQLTLPKKATESKEDTEISSVNSSPSVAKNTFFRWTQFTIHNSQFTIPLLLTALGLGGAAATKFSAAALAPILGLLALWLAWRWRSWRPFLFLLAAGGVAALVVWGVYRFQLRPFPAAAYWQDLLWQFDYFSRPHGAYLFGQYAETGWWYYFPIAFLLKTPLPTLLLLTYALLRLAADLWRRRLADPFRQWNLMALLGTTAVYTLISLFTPLNIGYRHLLPILPFLFLFIALSLAPLRPRSPAPLLLLWLLLIALLAWPDYIPYLNRLAGPAESRWRVLSDSNIDWGQDLPALADWQRDSGQPLYLSYFGTAHPSAYGLDFVALPTWEPGPEQLPPFRQPFNPADPAPGYYAISVTNLQGLVLGEAHDTFAWFREREPLARIGGSIFLYEVAARGEPVNVAFSDLRPAELAPELHAALQSNDVRPRWFNGRSSLLWPVGGGWWVQPADQPIDELLLPYVNLAEEVVSADGAQRLARPVYPPALPWTERLPMGETAVFLGHSPIKHNPTTGEIALLTGWEVLAGTQRPLKIFVHALDETGQIVGQWDGLDVEPAAWQPGDRFVQLHRFSAPETAVIATFAIGLYDGDTLERLGMAVIDN